MNDELTPRPPTRADFQNRNPFGQDTPFVSPLGALANAEQQRSIAEVQARMIIARSNPRNPIRCMDLILQDCTRPSLAKDAFYQYARGGSSVTGPSIRLAESIARRWGNIASGIKEISRAGGYSECVAYAWDLETGYYDERQFQVRHWRDTKQGGYQITDERDIYELIANMGQRRKRAVLLTVIPGDVVEAATDQCEETLAANADTSPDALRKMVEAFTANFGVTQAQIEKRCQCRMEAIRPAQIVQLSKIFASLRDEMSSPKDWFEDGETINLRRPGAATSAPAPKETLREPAQPKAEKKAAPPAQEAARTSAPPAATQAPPKSTPAPAPSPEPARGAFEAWLLDQSGDPVEGEHGVARFSDPVAYARAVVDYLGSCFPADIQAIEAANSDDMDRAALASQDASAIFQAHRDLGRREPPDGDVRSEPATDQPTQQAELIDRNPLEINPPETDRKAEWERYCGQVKVYVGSCTGPAMLAEFERINSAVYLKLPAKYRIEVLSLVDARRKELSPPPALGEKVDAQSIFDRLAKAIDACQSERDIEVLEKSDRTADALAALKTLDFDLHAQIRERAAKKFELLTGRPPRRSGK
jgi:hypothetical protein